MSLRRDIRKLIDHSRLLSPMASQMFTISLEDHFISEATHSSESVTKLGLHRYPPSIKANLVDIGQRRLQHMDQGGVNLQVVSAIPCAETATVCHAAKVQLARAVEAHPSRFAGFACLPMHDPAAARDKLEYCVSRQGF